MAKTILLADDSMTIQKVVELTFMDQDFEVTAVSDGGAAIAALDQTQPDIVIADVHMPNADGYAVCRHSKSKNPGTPVLLLVGTFEQFDEQQAAQAGADGHLKKPFDSQELLQKVETMVAGSGSVPAPPTPESQPELTTQFAASEPAASEPVAAEPAVPTPPAPEPAAPAVLEFTSPEPAAPAPPEFTSPEPAPAPPEFTSPEPAPPAPEFTSPEPAAPQPAAPQPAAAAADIDDFTSPEPAPPSQDFTSPEPAAPEPLSAPEPAAPAAPSPAETVAVSQVETPEPASSEPASTDFAPSSAATRPRRAEAPPSDAAPADSHGNGDGSLSDEDVERIARKVVELAGGDLVQEIAWEVIPDLAEVVIRERIQELEGEVD